MEQAIKYRLTGAIILVSLMIIFLPLLFDGAGYEELPHIKGRSAAEPPIVFEQYFPNLEQKAANPGAALEQDASPREKQEPDPAGHAAPDNEPGKAAPTPRQWIVQAGVFLEQGNAEVLAAKLRDKQFKNIYMKMVEIDGKPAHAVRLGPFDEAEAQRIAEQVGRKLSINADVKVKQ